MEKKIMLIINPMSGRARYRGYVANVLEIFSAGGYSATVYMTQHVDHARILAQTNAEGYDIVACIGGDGTLAETIAGLMALDNRPPVGYIPMGTANDMANTLGLPKSASRAAELILNGNPMPIDIGRFGDNYFVYIAAFGAFTEVSYSTPRGSKQALGHLAYVLEGMSRLPKITPYRLRLVCDDGTWIEGDFIFGGVTNTTSIAGFVKIKPDAVDLCDGKFELILVKNPKHLGQTSQIFMDILTQKYDREYVQILHAKSVRFMFDEDVPWTRDGESGGEHRDVQLSIIPAGVQIFVP